MTKQHKITAGITVASFTLLYLTETLWPLVRFCVTATAIVALSGSCFFGVRHYLAVKRRDADPETPTRTLPPLMGSIAATLGTFILLAFIPSNSPSILTPFAEANNKAVTTTTVDRAIVPSPATTVPDNETRTNATAEPPVTTVRRQSPASDAADEHADERAAAEFIGALLGAAAQQEQRQQNDPRYQQFKQSMEAASKCPRCGGAGTYRYVDGAGVLQARSCPKCLGSGRAY